MNNEFVIFGLHFYKKIISQIEEELQIKDSFFQVKLILTEAITNAYYHGNNRDSSKSIRIYYEFDGKKLYLEIQDCGDGKKQVKIKQFSEDMILEERGRGLYLINCYCDKVEFLGNKLIIEKTINKE